MPSHPTLNVPSSHRRPHGTLGTGTGQCITTPTCSSISTSTRVAGVLIRRRQQHRNYFVTPRTSTSISPLRAVHRHPAGHDVTVTSFPSSWFLFPPVIAVDVIAKSKCRRLFEILALQIFGHILAQTTCPVDCFRVCFVTCYRQLQYL